MSLSMPFESTPANASATDLAVLVDHVRELLFDGVCTRGAHYGVQAVVRVDDPGVGVDLQEPQGQGLGQPVEQLLPGSKRLVGGHLLGDVHHLRNDASGARGPRAGCGS